MITVTLFNDKEKRKVSLKVVGHAGADVKGKDLVCASATMLMYTFLQDVMDAYRFDKLKKKPTVELEEGNVFIEAECKKDDYAETLHTLFVIQQGYLLLEHNNKDYVEVNRFDTEKSVENK
jgi:uncharacterized protein YsxB (DUF464 family)